jgi:hypothetical protein
MKMLIQRSHLIRTIGSWQELVDPWTNEFYYVEPHNTRDGPGKISYANGNVFIGTFRRGMRHGHGKMINADGNMYEGTWIDDNRQGGGTYTYHPTKDESLRLKVFGY